MSASPDTSTDAGTEAGAAVKTPAVAISPGFAIAIPSAVTVIVMLWGISGPSFNRDEAATLSAVHRSLPELFRVLGHLDAVHGAYYTLIWTLTRLFGQSEAVVRMPSALAMAAAAAGVTVLGRRLAGLTAGILAGLVFAILPIVSYWGQDARSPALVTALATGATYLFVRVLDAPAGRRKRWLAAYAASLALLGLVNIFGLLLIAAHAVTAAARWRRTRRLDAAGAGVSRGAAIGLLIAAASAVVVVSPLMAVALPQRSQINWLSYSQNGKLVTLWQLAGPPRVTAVVLAILLLGLGFSALGGRARLRADWPAELAEFCLPWLILPTVILLVVSQLISPVFVLRYVLFCVPAAAILAGAALAAFGRITGPVGRIAGPLVLAALLVITMPSLVGYRGPAGHGDNIRAIDKVLAAKFRPGDAMFYAAYVDGNFPAPYRYGLAQVPDLALATSPVQAGNLTGTQLPASQIRERMSKVTRLWVLEVNSKFPVPLIGGLNFHLAGTWKRTDLWLMLYVRNG